MQTAFPLCKQHSPVCKQHSSNPMPNATVKNKSSKKRRKGRSLILTDTLVNLRLRKEQEENN